MRKFPTYRARGSASDDARGPQIDEGIFELSVGPSNDPRPQFYTAMAWSDGPITSDELWAYRTQDPGGAASRFSNVSSGEALYIDKVADSNAFSIPSGHSITDAETLEAFCAHASKEWKLKHNVDDNSANWTCTVARPSAPSFPGGNRDGHKLEKGQAYAVHQLPLFGPDDKKLTAWVWVPDEGGREIWLHYRPGQINGYAAPGSSPEGLPTPATEYVRTRLVFTQWRPDDVEFATWGLHDLPYSVNEFRKYAVLHSDSPTPDKDEPILIDYGFKDR